METTSISKDSLIKHFCSILLETEKRPVSIYKFCKELNIEEVNFYDHFSNFEALEKSIIASFAHQTIEVLNNSEEYKTYDSKSKLLSFYFTFFELLGKNRSLTLILLKGDKIKTLSKLKHLKSAYQDYLKTLNIELTDLKIDALDQFQNKSVSEVSWGQLLYTIQFWINDESTAFVKTDQLIEKTVQAGFDIINNPALNSIIDLGKFIWKEKNSFK